MDCTGLEVYLIEGADEPRVRKDRPRARNAYRLILQHVPDSGNLRELGGDSDEIKAKLLERIEAGGVEFSPVFLLIVGALINLLIQWWFSDVSAGTKSLERIKHSQRAPR